MPGSPSSVFAPSSDEDGLFPRLIAAQLLQIAKTPFVHDGVNGLPYVLLRALPSYKKTKVIHQNRKVRKLHGSTVKDFCSVVERNRLKHLEMEVRCGKHIDFLVF